MPITPTEKIWMNGELVDWDDAKIHVLTHTLHYGTGVFEGIRAYETDRGPGGVPPHRPHRAAVRLSAKIFMMDIPFTRRRARRGDQARPCGSTGCPSATSARSPTTATARWASTRCRARSTCPSPAGRGAPTWATTRVTKGVRMKISSWTRHDHNTMPPAAKTTGNYVNSSLAKVEALKAGYDEAIMLNPQGYVSECTGENIFVVRDGALHHAAASAPARSRASPSDSVTTIAERPRRRRRDRQPRCAATSTSPTRCSCAAPPPRSSPIRRSTTASSRAPAR